MPFVRIADTAKVELVGFIPTNGATIANVLHVRLADANQTVANLNAIATAVETALSAHMANFTSSMEFLEIIVTGLASATSPQVQVGISIPGTGSATSMPGACALTKLLTASRGRSFRGRIYWGPIPTNAVSGGGGVLTSSSISSIDLLTGAIETNLNALTPSSNLVVASRVLGTSADVTSGLCEPTVAYQRRRSLR